MSSSILQYKSEEPETAVCGERNSDMLEKISLVNKFTSLCLRHYSSDPLAAITGGNCWNGLIHDQNPTTDTRERY